jgi:hypothetical protein
LVDEFEEPRVIVGDDRGLRAGELALRSFERTIETATERGVVIVEHAL